MVYFSILYFVNDSVIVLHNLVLIAVQYNTILLLCLLIDVLGGRSSFGAKCIGSFRVLSCSLTVSSTVSIHMNDGFLSQQLRVEWREANLPVKLVGKKIRKEMVSSHSEFHFEGLLFLKTTQYK